MYNKSRLPSVKKEKVIPQILFTGEVGDLDDEPHEHLLEAYLREVGLRIMEYICKNLEQRHDGEILRKNIHNNIIVLAIPQDNVDYKKFVNLMGKKSIKLRNITKHPMVESTRIKFMIEIEEVKEKNIFSMLKQKIMEEIK